MTGLKGRKCVRRKDSNILNKRSGSEKVLFGAVFARFVLYALSLILPFLFLFFNSMKTGLEYMDGLVGGNAFALPQSWEFSNYLTALNGMAMIDSLGNSIYLPQMFLNSFMYSGLTAATGVFASSLTSYCLAKYRFRLRGVLYGIAIFTMTIPIIGTTGASFKLMSDLGLYNTPFYILCAGFSGFGFNFLVLYAFFKGIPWSYAEAVFIDGGGHSTVFFRVMLPQALPSLLTLGIITFIGAWNDYMTVLLFLPDYPTVSSGLYQMQTLLRAGDYPAYYAGILISVIPILILFGCFSDVIMKNMTVGGLKG